MKKLGYGNLIIIPTAKRTVNKYYAMKRLERCGKFLIMLMVNSTENRRNIMRMEKRGKF